MKLLSLLLLTALIPCSLQSALADEVPPSIGTCYYAYGCIGAAAGGSWSEDQCRQMGGHSLDVGGICLSL